jgi:hypothetical protein
MKNMEGVMCSNMDSYKINERAWEALLARVLSLYDNGNGESKSAIARLLGCNRSTVHRWIEDKKQSSNVTFRDMVRYLDRLRIPLVEVFGSGADLPPPSPDKAITELDKAIASTLLATAKVLGKSFDDVSRDLESLDLPDIQALLKGREPMRTSDFHRICRAVGVSPEAILSKASRGIE